MEKECIDKGGKIWRMNMEKENIDKVGKIWRMKIQYRERG